MVATSRSDRNVRLAFGAALLAVLLVGNISYRALVVLSDSNSWVRHTDDVLKTLQDLLICVKSIESDAREYVLTGNEFYTQSVPDLKLKAERDLAMIGNLTADNAAQLRRMSAFRQITTSPGETTIVTAIISMGRSLKLRVVAEGVETAQELAFLQAHHCDEAQGYYFGRPVPAEEFATLLATGVAASLLTLRPQFAGASLSNLPS